MSTIRASISLRSREKGLSLYRVRQVLHAWYVILCSYQVHYLFGGNPGRACLPNLRLNDFWQLKLCRPSHEQILKRCKLLIRKHKFEELALNNSVEALEYLQTKVSEIIDHNDVEQTKEVLNNYSCQQRINTHCLYRILKFMHFFVTVSIVNVYFIQRTKLLTRRSRKFEQFRRRIRKFS